MKNKYVRLVMDIILFVILFYVIQLLTLELTAAIAAWLNDSGRPFSTLFSIFQTNGRVVAVATAMSSILTAILFWRLHWTPIGRSFLQSRQWVVLLWVGLLTIGYILPLEWLNEELHLEMPEAYQHLFAGIMREPWGYIAIGILGPVAEEVVFRGAILRKLLKVCGDGNRSHWTAIVISALIFGAVHGNLPQAFNAFCIGLLLGWLYYRSHSIIPGLLVHFINNSVSYAVFNLFPWAQDGNLIDLFQGNSRMMTGGILFSLCILIPSLYQVAVRLHKAK